MTAMSRSPGAIFVRKIRQMDRQQVLDVCRLDKAANDNVRVMWMYGRRGAQR
jgi:hypothetical protein